MNDRRYSLRLMPRFAARARRDKQLPARQAKLAQEMFNVKM
jgi:hypothetical protein